jgi:uncharacterized BrkB/YihY/UPF0761 family membrane protein
MLWTPFINDWLKKRQAAYLFAISTLLVFALVPVFLGRVHTNSMSFWTRLPWGILGILGPIALFFLWIGMWLYWVRVDNSSPWKKRLSFVVLLAGFWWGSCIYYLAVYLPQAMRRSREAR